MFLFLRLSPCLCDAKYKMHNYTVDNVDSHAQTCEVGM